MIEGIVLITLLYVAIGIVFILRHFEIKRQEEFIISIDQSGAFPVGVGNPYAKNIKRKSITSVDQYNDYLKKRLDKLSKADQVLGKNQRIVTLLLYFGILCLIVTISLIFIIDFSLAFFILVELFIIAILAFILASHFYSKSEIQIINKYLEI